MVPRTDYNSDRVDAKEPKPWASYYICMDGQKQDGAEISTTTPYSIARYVTAPEGGLRLLAGP